MAQQVEATGHRWVIHVPALLPPGILLRRGRDFYAFQHVQYTMIACLTAACIIGFSLFAQGGAGINSNAIDGFGLGAGAAIFKPRDAAPAF